LVPRALAAAARGANLRIGDSGISTPRVDIIGITYKFILVLTDGESLRNPPIKLCAKLHFFFIMYKQQAPNYSFF